VTEASRQHLARAQAVRNFVQLCLEGYYDGCIFHRIIHGFLAQSGDPTGTGTGGESVYGRPFADEFHSRLRFCHRRGALRTACAAPVARWAVRFSADAAPCAGLVLHPPHRAGPGDESLLKLRLFGKSPCFAVVPLYGTVCFQCRMFARFVR